MHGMYFAKDNALNEQKHETLPVFAEIGNKHPQLNIYAPLKN